ncbi:type II toxin-antitoxin system YafQ family toxin [Xylocopilactobacillus apicola]|uniref:Toxin n=1 Tax=Xylocopilactobacillus apicola TaxID=2932184 RepID=A0AAU9D6V9_9LACO|nr:type II toxin-antitoxin system YafQ family toxin [Xylocopilactobacillus apicola]BDR58040.1 toxin [Xylocopilactobacillus apicola]
MSKFEVKFSSNFKRNFSGGRYKKDDFLVIFDILTKGHSIPEKYFDHQLVNRKPVRELHIKPDWLLIYKYIDENTIRLIDTGTHSDLFD